MVGEKSRVRAGWFERQNPYFNQNTLFQPGILNATNSNNVAPTPE
jgi:hypothetical protein